MTSMTQPPLAPVLTVSILLPLILVLVTLLSLACISMMLLYPEESDTTTLIEQYTMTRMEL